MGARPQYLFLVGIASALVLAPAGQPAATRESWQQAVGQICRHPLLFEHAHAIGTEQGARAVARDIRASTGRRLGLIGAVRARPDRPTVARRWIRAERDLANTYADAYLRIWHAIDAARTLAARRRLPDRLERLVHRPDRLRAAAEALEVRLRVPDCTGGENTATASFITNP